VARVVAIAAGLAFAGFVVAAGIPTLRHDWNWPVDRLAIPSFLSESTSGWLSIGFGIANPHPTTYLIALPLAAAMWIFGPLPALGLLAFAIGYCCARGAANAIPSLGVPLPAATGVALFALFNPWVYNEVVAGHLVMVLAYGGLLALWSEMALGRGASPIRLALWLALIEMQLQFFIVAMAASIAFALATKKWLPIAAAAVVALPTAVGLIGERGALLQTPYNVEWQTNQSLSPVALLSLGGYFPGYADRLGLAAQVAVWALCGLAVAGLVVGRRRRAIRWTAAAAGLVYVCALGVHGPLDAAYEWIVRSIPESGVFRELYDFGGVFAALIMALASAATVRAKALGYLMLVAGAVLPITWLLHPPSGFWVSSHSYPRANVSAPPFSRVTLLPAFQPLQLRAGGGDGADPDAFAYPGHVTPLNAYLPAYPVDMALARYTQNGDASVLRALGVAQIVNRPWLVSRSNGVVGLAASSVAGARSATSLTGARALTGPAPLVSQCDGMRIVASVDSLAPCDVFFSDAPGYAIAVPFGAPSDSVDAATAWIDARLAFARAPFLAQGLGGALTQSAVPHRVRPGSWVLAYVRGKLSGTDGHVLVVSPGAFSWISIPPNLAGVVCAGLCELVAESPSFPALPLGRRDIETHAVPFEQLEPWLYHLQYSAGAATLLRFNERYDPGWTAISAWRVLPHVRLDLSANGWFVLDPSSNDVILIQVTALLQLIAELAGAACVLLLLKALVRGPTKRLH
jgi:hypothetical protein